MMNLLEETKEKASSRSRTNQAFVATANSHLSQNETPSRRYSGLTGKYRWKRGESGNPSGRPKGTTLAKSLAKELVSLQFDKTIEELGAKLVDQQLEHLALGILYLVAQCPTEPGMVKISAAKALLEYRGKIGAGRNQLHGHIIDFSPETKAWLTALHSPSLTPHALPMLTDATGGSLAPAIAIPSPGTAE